VKTPFVVNLIEYVKSFENCYEVLWTVWAQQMDSMGVMPQVHRLHTKKKSWMDFTFNGGKDQEMIESTLKVDLAYEYYLSHVL
jgi:hypothetical protein